MTFNFPKQGRPFKRAQPKRNRKSKMSPVFQRFRQPAPQPNSGHGLQAYLMVIFVTLVMVSDLVSWVFYVVHTGWILYQYLDNLVLGGDGPLQILFSKWDLVLSALMTARLGMLAYGFLRKRVRPWAWGHWMFGYWAGLVQAAGLTGEGSDSDVASSRDTPERANSKEEGNDPIPNHEKHKEARGEGARDNNAEIGNALVEQRPSSPLKKANKKKTKKKSKDKDKEKKMKKRWGRNK